MVSRTGAAGERFGGKRPERLPSTPVRPDLTRGRIVAAALVAASVVATVWLSLTHPLLIAVVPLPDVPHNHVDFDTFWNSAVALLHGRDIYATPAKLTNLNPPLLTVLLAPFALLDALTGYRIWIGLVLVSVTGSMVAVARELRLHAGATALAMVGVLASSSVHGTLVLGQIYPLLLIGLVAGWIAERHGHPVLAAVLFGIIVALKPSLAPILLLPAVQRRWAPLRAGVIAATGATLLGVAVCGPYSGVEWVRIALAAPVPDTVDNASLPGLAVRFGLPSTVGQVAGLVVLAATLSWAGHARRRLPPTGTAPFAVAAAGLLCSPIAWHNYLMLLFPGVFVLIALHRGTAAWPMLALAAIPVSWNAPDAPGGLLGVVGGSLYLVILVGYWITLARAASTPVVTEPTAVVAVAVAEP